MNLIPRLAWLSAIEWRIPRCSGGPDFADMGAELGLDASLQVERVIPTGEKPGRSETGSPWPSQWLISRRRAG